MRLANDLSQRFPKDTVAQSKYLPMAHAAAALGGGAGFQAAHNAIVVLAAAPYDVQARSSRVNFNGCPVYLRGAAYLVAHQGAAAGAEFQKILDHPSVVVNQPIGALAHLGLGRAYALQGETLRARTAYQDFLALWKDADPDIPILKEAKAEYAKLQ
jgi:hypothetical protein